jgi:hypothetical protein
MPRMHARHCSAIWVHMRWFSPAAQVVSDGAPNHHSRCSEYATPFVQRMGSKVRGPGHDTSLLH